MTQLVKLGIRLQTLLMMQAGISLCLFLMIILSSSMINAWSPYQPRLDAEDVVECVLTTNKVFAVRFACNAIRRNGVALHIWCNGARLCATKMRFADVVSFSVGL